MPLLSKNYREAQRLPSKGSLCEMENDSIVPILVAYYISKRFSGARYSIQSPQDPGIRSCYVYLRLSSRIKNSVKL